jgi:hypothetical protein
MAGGHEVVVRSIINVRRAGMIEQEEAAQGNRMNFM